MKVLLSLFVLGLALPLTAQNMTAPPAAYCDPATGLCTPAPIEEQTTAVEFKDDVEIIYVGDPMCSWCWGISPALNQLETAAMANGIRFRTLVGGLRPGGSDPWNDEFKGFLKHHWEEVNARSGQPFGYALFDQEQFTYDTEPSCRAVVAARHMDARLERRFFELVQHHFYVQSQDPNVVSFYAPICAELGLDFKQFSSLFNSDEIKAATRAEFQLNRSWGVTGYPTVIYRSGNQLTAIAQGYSTFEQMWAAVNDLSTE